MPSAMATDSKYIYWITESSRNIARANLDGSDVDLDLGSRLELRVFIVVDRALVEELDVHAFELRVEPFQLADLVLDVLAVVLRNLDVATTDHDLHETSRLIGCSRFDASPSTPRPTVDPLL